MKRSGARFIFGAAGLVAGVILESSGASAQTFQGYRCEDGTHFIAAFYPYDSRAHLQIDGQAVTLAKRLNWSGSRYSGRGVTLIIARASVTVKHETADHGL